MDIQDLEIHPLVQLLVARMESHPYEFHASKRVGNHHNTKKPTYATMTSEFAGYITRSEKFWNRAEKALYNKTLRKVRMEEEHHRLMEALLADK